MASLAVQLQYLIFLCGISYYSTPLESYSQKATTKLLAHCHSCHSGPFQILPHRHLPLFLYTDFIFANMSLKSELLLAKLVCRGTNNSLLFSNGLALIQLSLKEEQPNIYEGQNWLRAEAILLQLTCPQCVCVGGGGGGGELCSLIICL